MIVIKTLTASAQVAAEAVDSLGWHEIAGTLAGDNTIFVAIRKKEQVSGVANRFRAMVRADGEGDAEEEE
jgi:transcriptional regulator of arginine metabolism